MAKRVIIMEATIKENKVTADSMKNMLIMFLCGVILTFLGFKALNKPDYRPIVITDVSAHSLNTSYQATIPERWNIVNFSVSINASLTLVTGQTGQIVLQTSPDNASWTTVCTAINGNTGTLSIGINTLNSQTVQMIGTLPPNYYYRLVPSGTATTGMVGGREVAF